MAASDQYNRPPTPFDLAPSTPYQSPQPTPVPLTGCRLATAIASDEANTVQDMLKELRQRLHSVLRESIPEPAVNQACETEGKPISPLAQEIRGISSSLNVSKHIINDILARLEV